MTMETPNFASQPTGTVTLLNAVRRASSLHIWKFSIFDPVPVQGSKMVVGFPAPIVFYKGDDLGVAQLGNAPAIPCF